MRPSTWITVTALFGCCSTTHPDGVVITSFTATEVVATFVANPVPDGSASGMPAITNGVFDLAL